MIQAEDLSKQFGDFWAVNGVYLDVNPGQVLALLGQNGSGKTTTIRMLTSVLFPTRGRARIAGYDVSEHPDKVRSLVGVLTEQQGLYLRMTGEKYLDFFGRVYRMDATRRQKRIKELMEYFGLDMVIHQNIGEYSKGMRQKLALARTLIHEPPVILLDEPTSAMDPESAQLVRNSITNLRAKNRSIIICTHNLVEAELLADQVAIIYRGRILVSGSVAELKRRLLGPAEYEVRTLHGWQRGNLLLPPGVDLVAEDESGCHFRVAEPEISNPVLLHQMIECGAKVVTMQEVPHTLEQVYIAALAQVKYDAQL